jgi:integrase
MPRLSHGSVPKYRKHKASGQALVTIAGRGYYLGPYKSKASLVEYDRLITEWLAAGRPASFGAPPDELTVLQLIVRYLQFAKRRYHRPDRRTDEYGCICESMKPLKRLYGHTPAAQFGPTAFKAVRMSLINSGLARSTVNGRMARIRRMFKWAAAEELIPASIPQSLSMVEGLRKGETEARESEPVRPVSDQDFQAVLPHLPEVVADMARVQRLTGCRPGEVCALRPCDVDRSGDVWIYQPSDHKTAHRGRERLIFIGPKAQDVLRPYLLRPAESFCFQPCESEKKRRAALHAARNTPLSCGNRPGTNKSPKPARPAGEQYDTAAYRRTLWRACHLAFPAPEPLGRREGETLKAWNARLTEQQKKELAEWQSSHRWSPNQLRHSTATEIRKRYGLEAAQVILGHSKADVTQIYAERDLALGVRVAAEVG